MRVFILVSYYFVNKAYFDKLTYKKLNEIILNSKKEESWYFILNQNLIIRCYWEKVGELWMAFIKEIIKIKDKGKVTPKTMF